MANPCGRVDCPIVAPEAIDRRSLRVVHFDAGMTRYRVTKARYVSTPFTPAVTEGSNGAGSGRFSPLAGRAHTYVAAQRSAALLESALHEAAGPNPRIYRSQLTELLLSEVRFEKPVRLIDLRDDALANLGIERGSLTDANALHYPCTQAVAARIVGTKRSHGLIWTSRQGALHAERNRDGLASEVLRHESLDVAVVYSPDYPGTSVTQSTSEPLLINGQPTRFVLELANLLRIAIL